MDLGTLTSLFGKQSQFLHRGKTEQTQTESSDDLKGSISSFDFMYKQSTASLLQFTTTY